jgi:tetratricopeptide (TPR) repeat protein
MGHASHAKSGPRRWGSVLLFVSILIALLLVTAWNLTRSDALEQARRAYERVDLVGCLQHALDHLERRPWSREAALLAARCLSRRDYPEQAEPYFRRAGRLSLSDLQIRAYGMVRGPHPERAIPAFEEILDRSPGNVTAMRRLAAVLLAQRDIKPLLKLADQLERTPGGEVIGSMLRGVAYHNDRNQQQAVAAFERVLELDPDLNEMPASRAMFSNHYAMDLINSGRIEDAGRYLARALAKHPDAELMNILGNVYFLRGETEEAERCFRQAVEWDPRNFAPRLSLVSLAIQRRRLDEAAQQLNQVRLLVPRRSDVLLKLVSVYQQLGQTAEADRVKQAIRELRTPTAAPARRNQDGSWPRYAL